MLSKYNLFHAFTFSLVRPKGHKCSITKQFFYIDFKFCSNIGIAWITAYSVHPLPSGIGKLWWTIYTMIDNLSNVQFSSVLSGLSFLQKKSDLNWKEIGIHWSINLKYQSLIKLNFCVSLYNVHPMAFYFVPTFVSLAKLKEYFAQEGWV